MAYGCGLWFMVLRWSIYELYKRAGLNDVIANINILNLWLRFTQKVASLTLSLSNPLFIDGIAFTEVKESESTTHLLK